MSEDEMQETQETEALDEAPETETEPEPEAPPARPAARRKGESVEMKLARLEKSFSALLERMDVSEGAAPRDGGSARDEVERILAERDLESRIKGLEDFLLRNADRFDPPAPKERKGLAKIAEMILG